MDIKVEKALVVLKQFRAETGREVKLNEDSLAYSFWSGRLEGLDLAIEVLSGEL